MQSEKPTPEQPKSRERWRMVGTASDWGVTTVKDGRVGLSGPGPCRSYQEIPLDDFMREWERVP